MSALTAQEPSRRTMVPTANVDGCVVTRATCGDVVLGQLTTGDCISSANGAFLDTIRFNVGARQLFAVTLRPLADTFANATLVAVSPANDGSLAPGMLGGPYASISYATGPIPGDWSIGVTSEDTFARGKYAVEITCESDDQPDEPAGCVTQELACGQRAIWRLDANSCRFSDTRAYNMYYLYAQAGEFVQLEMISSTFDPSFAIYDDASNAKLQNSAFGPGRADLGITIPKNGWYFVLAGAGRVGDSGTYVLQLKCPRSSGCLDPVFTQKLPDLKVPFGSSPTLALPVHFHGPQPHFELFSLDPSYVFVSSSSQPAIQTAPITSKKQYFVRATNECGFANTNVFTIAPESSSKRRAAKH